MTDSTQLSMAENLFGISDSKKKCVFEVEIVSSDWLKSRLTKGCKCPLCGQYAKIYPRSINAEMARVLILMYRHFTKYPNSNPIHLDSFLSKVCGASRPKGNNHSLLVHWGLIERVGSRVSKAGIKRDGYYSITRLGGEFVEDRKSVPEHVYMYNNKRIGESDERVSIHQCLKHRFTRDSLLCMEPFGTVEFI